MVDTSLLQRFWRENGGMAMAEFALGLPVFLTLSIGGIEATNLALAHLRVSNLAMTVADNAGRVMSGVDEADIYEVFSGAQVIGESIDFEANGRVVLSSLEANGQSGSNAGQMIRWQRCWGDMDVEPAYGEQGDGRYDAALATGLGADGHRITAMQGTALMFAEVTYAYQPLVTTGFFPSTTIRYESAFNVRGRQNNAISNTQSLTVLACD
ncbi:TadE/TadG family type IV pilus assembly protein [Croceicoccus sp. Ery5]|uniref:TadE/TadG family type IV pilus assembly protein n=1 Tax=Croceicoccus sp. Ery5 TaxID=1703340 RepID=UPI001E3A5E98|nr:TadE/TadG family type IV pilus assembly protein [Croceicoccus sp. Ery5]